MLLYVGAEVMIAHSILCSLLRPCSDGDGMERNGMERNDCVPILFCVRTGTQSFLMAI